MLRRQIRIFDVLVHLVKARHYQKVRAVDGLAHRVRKAAGQADIEDTAIADVISKIVYQSASIHVKHAVKLDKPIILTLVDDDEQQVMPRHGFHRPDQ